MDRIDIPEQVRARLDLSDARGVAALVKATGALEEERFVATVELRRDDDGKVTVEGYAATTEVPYDVAGGAPYGWVETIAKGAFRKALKERDDVRFLVNHDGMALARTKSGTMRLVEDNIGLRVVAELDPVNPTVASLVSAIERGDMDQMSFAFRAERQEWNADYTERRIVEVRLLDVSAVTYPANEATHIMVRDDEGQAPVVNPPAMRLSVARAHADALRCRRVA